MWQAVYHEWRATLLDALTGYSTRHAYWDREAISAPTSGAAGAVEAYHSAYSGPLGPVQPFPVQPYYNFHVTPATV